MSGWIKISRKLNEHWLWEDAERLKWWLDLLLMAAWDDKKTMHDTHVFTLKKGQIIASVSFLCERWGKSNKTIVKFLHLLEQEQMIMRTTLHRQTPIITISNYESYQERNDSKVQTTVHSTVHGTVQTMLHTIKEDNLNNNNLKENPSKEGGKESATVVATPAKGGIDEKIKAFYDELIPYVSVYGKEMVRDFFEYWTEKNESGTQFRKQREKTWNTSHRLRMWAKQENKFGKYGCNTSNQSTPQQRANDVAELIARLGAKNKPFEG